jgi:NAD(P)-dependent dehydrogenase (short-subunit alcohol dehydrogenase family)
MGRLDDKICIVTGGARGIGRKAAITFAEEGAKVVIADLDLKQGEKTVNEIIEMGHQGILIGTNVAQENDCKLLIQKTKENYGKIDVLYNNAGIDIFAPAAEFTEEEVDRILNVNFKGAFFCCKYTIPEMVNNNGGSIINQSSIGGINANKNNSIYCASKAALILFSKGLALDYGQYNVRVNSICPGWTRTEMFDQNFSNLPNPEEAKKQLNDLHPLGRVAETKDIANAALFLASDESSFMTGSTLLVDGGRLCWF